MQFKSKRKRDWILTKPIQIEVTSHRMAVREALSQLMPKMKRHHLSDDVMSRVELVLAEALNNIVEHAYPEGTPDGPMRVACTREGDILKFTIRDEGLGMPDGVAPTGRAQRVDVDVMNLPEGGFGWFLIREQAEDVCYHRNGWENCLSFSIRIED